MASRTMPTPVIQRPPCPRCGQSSPIRYGKVNHCQRWQCRACLYEYTRLENLAIHASLRQHAAKLYEEGQSSNAIAERLGISPTSVLKWTRQHTWPQGRVYNLKPRLHVPEPYRTLFRISKCLK